MICDSFSIEKNVFFGRSFLNIVEQCGFMQTDMVL